MIAIETSSLELHSGVIHSENFSLAFRPGAKLENFILCPPFVYNLIKKVIKIHPLSQYIYEIFPSAAIRLRDDISNTKSITSIFVVFVIRQSIVAITLILFLSIIYFIHSINGI